jgi:hypothetical protein
MRPSLKALRSRASERAHSAAEGASPPAAHEAAAANGDGGPGALERGTMRRRLRRARRLRENLMTELGALVMEMHRQGRHDQKLVERKAREALVADREVAALARALRMELTLNEVYAAGIAGHCHACGALLATDDRFCSRCGARTVGVAEFGLVARPVVDAEDARDTAVSGPPPDASARVAAPPAPDPSARAAAPPAPSGATPPPPAPSTRVQGPGADATQIATGPPRE